MPAVADPSVATDDMGFAQFVPTASATPAHDDSLGFDQFVPPPDSTEAYAPAQSGGGNDFGFGQLVAPTPTSEAEKALAETPKVPPQVADVFEQSKGQQQIEANAIGPAWAEKIAAPIAEHLPETGPAPQWVRNAVDAAIETGTDFVPKTANEIAAFLTPAAGAPEEIHKTYSMVRDWISGDKSIDEAGKTNFPESQTLIEADKTPAWSKERFKAGFGVLSQFAMLAGGAHGLAKSAGETTRPVETKPVVSTERPTSETQRFTEPGTPAAETESTFKPSTEWQEIPEGTVLPNGGEYRIDQATGKNYARWSEENLPTSVQQASPEGESTSTDVSTGENPATSTTGVANRVLQAEAEAGKIGEVQPGEGMSWQEMVDMGREQLNAGADPQQIARRFQRNQRISPQDFAVLRAERERLAVESNKAADAARANPEDPAAQQALTDARKTETDWVRDVVQPAKTSTSDIFRGMQGEAPIDATTFEGLRRAALDVTGKEPSIIEKVSIERKARSVRKASEAENAALKQMSEKVEKTLPKSRTPKIEELRDEIARMVEELTPCK